MLDAAAFLTTLRSQGFGLVSGVPCSLLTGWIDTLIATPETDYVAAANEGEALAVAAGASLAGPTSVCFFQNSGFGNAVNPLTSLTETFRIPVLLMPTWRGDPAAAPDEPQHAMMGRITPRLLELLEIGWRVLPTEEAEVEEALAEARAFLSSQGRPYALVVRKGTFTGGPEERARPEVRRPTRDGVPPPATRELDPDEVLARVHAATERDALLATTGYTGRALYGVGDRPNQLYMVGSMGCVSSLGLGIARVRPDLRVVVLDGDGAFLMRMGAVATLGYERPPNLLHVLLDNGVHDSTGAQSTVSRSVDPAAIARACGYPRVLRADSLEELEEVLAAPTEELTFVHVLTGPRTDRKLPRPTIRPHEVADRFRGWIAGR